MLFLKSVSVRVHISENLGYMAGVGVGGWVGGLVKIKNQLK